MCKSIHLYFGCWMLDVVLEGMSLIGLAMVAFNSAPFITLHFLAQPL
jgi:hypothetical protein